MLSRRPRNALRQKEILKFELLKTVRAITNELCVAAVVISKEAGIVRVINELENILKASPSVKDVRSEFSLQNTFSDSNRRCILRI